MRLISDGKTAASRGFERASRAFNRVIRKGGAPALNRHSSLSQITPRARLRAPGPAALMLFEYLN